MVETRKTLRMTRREGEREKVVSCCVESTCFCFVESQGLAGDEEVSVVLGCSEFGVSSEGLFRLVGCGELRVLVMLKERGKR